MSKIDDGGPASPVIGTLGTPEGMSLRDWFAGQAINSLSDLGRGVLEYVKLNAPATTKHFATMIAQCSYAIADAMLAERNKE